MENYDKKIMLKLAELEDDVSALKFVNQKNKLSAGNGITIQNNQISADTTTLATKAELAQKQNTLLAGENITIENNVISASGIASMQNDISDIYDKITALQNFVGYENIVYDQQIYNTSDVYERELEIIGSNIVYSPSVLFVTEKHLTSTDEHENITEYPISIDSVIDVDVSVDSAGDYVFMLYDKNTIIKTTTETFDVNETNTSKTITINSIVYNSLEDHTYYLCIQAQNTSTNKTITINSMKLTITAPNVTILNKISNFDATFNYHTNKYYLSDCSSGYAKLAEIDANDLHSTNDIVWTQTNIEAQSYKVFYINSQNNSGTTLGKKYAAITHKNDTVSIIDLSNNSTYYTSPRGTYKISPVITSHDYTQFYINIVHQNTIQCLYINLNQNGSVKTKLAITSDSTIANIECARNNKEYLPQNTFATCLAIKTTSQIVGYNITSKLNDLTYNFISDIKIYFDRKPSVYPYFRCYYKQFGTYYAFSILYSGSISQQGEITEIGSYDELFEGKNGDYFFVQNNTINFTSST